MNQKQGLIGRVCRIGAWACALLAPMPVIAVGEYAANDHSYGPSLSANGRYLAYTSLASNLVPEDTNGIEDVFVLDRQTNALARISTNAQGAQGDGQSWGVAISADGCFAAFASSATNLIAGDTNNATDIFRKNLPGCADANDGAVERVTVSSAEAQAGPVGPTLVGDARYATISGDGRFVAYFACLTGLVAGSDPCNYYIRDVQKGETHAIRTPTGGVFGGTLAIGTRPLAGPAGTEVRLAFSTTLPFVGADTNGMMDVYLGKLSVPDVGPVGSWTYTFVSAGIGGTGGNQPSSAQFETSYGVSISRDGDRVSFISAATNLEVFDNNGLPDVFVYDDDAAIKLTRESEITAITYVNTATLSPDGNYVVIFKGTLNTPALEQWVRKAVPGGASVNLGTGAPIGSRLESSGRGAVSDGGTVAAWHSFRYDPVLEGARVDLRDNIVVGTLVGNSLDSRIIASNGRIATAQDGHSRATAISGDGKVVGFSTYAWGYGLGDAGANRDVYLRTLATGALVRASSGFTSNVVDARKPDLSADGRRVVMLASGTVAQASVCGSEAYVPVAIKYDVASPTLQCLDADTTGFEGLIGGTFTYPSISDDGVWAAFSGKQTTTPFNSQIYLRNLNTQEIRRGTKVGGGGPLTGTANVDFEQNTFQLSGTGRYLVYSFSGTGSAAAPAGCTVLGTVALYDKDTDTTSMISRIGGNGTLATGGWASISSDGNWVAMVSCANLANESPAPVGENVFLLDRGAGTFQRVPSDRLGRVGPSSKARTRLSANGRYLAYIADSRCTIRCTTRERQIVMYDRIARSQRVISITSAWGRANGPSGTADDQGVDSTAFTLDMSNDGAKLVFASAATNFVPGDTNAADDVFVVDVATQSIARVSGFGAGLAGDRDRVSPTLSIDGTTVAYALKDRDAAIATAPAATAKDPSWPKAIGDKFADIAIVEGTGSTEEVVTVTAGGLPANGDSGEPDLSGDGNVVAYSTDATNLTTANDTNGFTDIVVYDTVAESNLLVSVAPGGVPANGPSEEPAATTKDLGDKYVVAYATDATNLQGIAATADVNNVSDVVVSIEAVGTELASRATGTNGAIGNGASAEADVMEGGTAVTFSSLASNLKPGDANGTTDIFLRDLAADSTIRISEPTGGGDANGPSSDASIGRDPTQPPNSWIVAFESDASNLVANDLNGSTDIFARVFDGTTTTTRLISHKVGSQLPATGTNTSPRVSRTGRYIIFVSSAPDLIVGDNNGLPDLFTYRISDGLITRVSTGVAQVQSNDLSVSGDVAVAGNGNALVVFDSAATNLTTVPDSEKAFDVFYRDANGNLVPVGVGDVIFRSGFEN